MMGIGGISEYSAKNISKTSRPCGADIYMTKKMHLIRVEHHMKEIFFTDLLRILFIRTTFGRLLAHSKLVLLHSMQF